MRWLRRLGVKRLRTGLSWADSLRPNAEEWFDRQMAALEEFETTVTFCFTPEIVRRAAASHQPSQARGGVRRILRAHDAPVCHLMESCSAGARAWWWRRTPTMKPSGAAECCPGCRDALIVHLTDGAPADRSDARAAGFASCQDYARARRAELLAAMRLAGIPAVRLREIGLTRPGSRRAHGRRRAPARPALRRTLRRGSLHASL